MTMRDEETEEYLEEFRPRAVRQLDLPHPTGTMWWKRLAAAAAVLASVGGGVWYARREAKPVRPEEEVPAARAEPRVEEHGLNTIALTKMAMKNDQLFEEQLEAESRKVLPDPRGERSTLRVLAKE